MPQINLPNSPPSSPPSNPPSRPPTGKPVHHGPPKTIPRVIPTPVPQPQPQTVPLGPVVVLIAAERALARKCLTGTETAVGKNPPKGNQSTRRQRPCSGGDPEIRYEEKKRKIGRFSVAASQQRLAINPEDYLRVRLRILARRAGYNINRSDFKAEAELDKARTFREAVMSSAAKTCHYQCYVFEKRRICTCPDGSKCRKTTRE